jgi:hypothetical protein
LVFLGFLLGFLGQKRFCESINSSTFFPSLVLVFMVSLATFAGFTWYFTVFYIHFLVLYPDLPQFFRFSRGGLKTTAKRMKWSKQQLMPQIVGGSGMVYGCFSGCL